MSTFYICATPIGNLDDISKRLIETLTNVDAIYAEDTRRANKLLNHLNIKKSVRSYFLGNETKKINEILDLLNKGNSIALISDAGTPLVSDPGQDLIKSLIENNIKIISIPGPSSILVALTLSGFDTDKFEFQGFIPKSGKNREVFFTSLKGLRNTLICFTSPKRLIKDLNEFINYEIENDIVVCREMTKKFETIYRGNASSLLDELNELNIKGEITIVISKSDNPETLNIDVQKAADSLLAFDVPKREIAKILSAMSTFSANEIYEKIKDS